MGCSLSRVDQWKLISCNFVICMLIINLWRTVFLLKRTFIFSCFIINFIYIEVSIYAHSAILFLQILDLFLTWFCLYQSYWRKVPSLDNFLQLRHFLNLLISLLLHQTSLIMHMVCQVCWITLWCSKREQLIQLSHIWNWIQTFTVLF